jgi:hypothetical protein
MTKTITKKENNIVTINILLSIIPLFRSQVSLQFFDLITLKIPSILRPHYHALY